MKLHRDELFAYTWSIHRTKGSIVLHVFHPSHILYIHICECNFLFTFFFACIWTRACSCSRPYAGEVFHSPPRSPQIFIIKLDKCVYVGLCYPRYMCLCLDNHKTRVCVYLVLFRPKTEVCEVWVSLCIRRAVPLNFPRKKRCWYRCVAIGKAQCLQTTICVQFQLIRKMYTCTHRSCECTCVYPWKSRVSIKVGVPKYVAHNSVSVD